MAWGWRIDLVGPIDCVRLSLHGGSLLAGVRPRLVTTRLPRAVRSRRSQISTISGTSPDRASGKKETVLQPQAWPMTVQDLLRHTAGLVYAPPIGTGAIPDAYRDA